MEDVKVVECLVSIQSTLISVLKEQKALRQDMQDMEIRLRQEIKNAVQDSENKLRQEMQDMEIRLKQEIKDTETRLKQEIKVSEEELKQEMKFTEIRIREDGRKDAKGLKNYIDIVAKGLQEHETNHIA